MGELIMYFGLFNELFAVLLAEQQKIFPESLVLHHVEDKVVVVLNPASEH